MQATWLYNMTVTYGPIDSLTLCTMQVTWPLGSIIFPCRPLDLQLLCSTDDGETTSALCQVYFIFTLFMYTEQLNIA